MTDNRKVKDITSNTLKEIVINSCTKFADKPAIVSKNTEGEFIERTYAQMHEDIKAIATEFSVRGYKGKNIAITGNNSYEWTVMYYAAAYMGAVPVPVDKLLKERDLQTSINRLDAQILLYGEEMEDVISRSDLNCETVQMQSNFNDLVASGKQALENGHTEGVDHVVKEEDKAAMYFTSGTTSTSKIVMLSHKNILSNLKYAQKMVRMTEDDRSLSVLPQYHTFECNLALNLVLSVGGKIVYNDEIKNFTENLKRFQPTMLNLVPKVLERIKEAIETEMERQNKTKMFNMSSKLLKHVKIIRLKRLVYKQILDNLGGDLFAIVVGGAALEPEVGKFFETIGIQLIQGYGLTEASPLVAVNPPYSRNLNSLGKVIDMLEAKLVDVDENGVGQLHVKGDSIMMGYYNDEEATKEAIDEDGFLNTGDLMSFDKDNFMTMQGRTKNLIITSNGENVSPEELEEHIYKNEIVKDVVVSCKKINNKDIISAEILLTDELTKKIKENEKYKDELLNVVKEYITELNSTLPKYKQIRDINITEEEFEKTSLMKIKRKRMG